MSPASLLAPRRRRRRARPDVWSGAWPRQRQHRVGAVVGIGALRDSPTKKRWPHFAVESDDDDSQRLRPSVHSRGLPPQTRAEPFDPAPGHDPGRGPAHPSRALDWPLLTLEPLATDLGPLFDLRSVGDGRVPARSFDEASGTRAAAHHQRWNNVDRHFAPLGPVRADEPERRQVGARRASPDFEAGPTELPLVFVSEDSGASWQDMAFDLEVVDRATGGSGYLRDKPVHRERAVVERDRRGQSSRSMSISISTDCLATVVLSSMAKRCPAIAGAAGRSRSSS